MKVDVKLEGLESLNKVFTKLPEITKEAVKGGLFIFTKDVAEYARANHPYQNQTGNLEASTVAMPPEVEDGKLVGVVKAGMEYAPFVEYGTSRSAPYPFLTPAVSALAPWLSESVKASVEAANARLVKVGTADTVITKMQYVRPSVDKKGKERAGYWKKVGGKK